MTIFAILLPRMQPDLEAKIKSEFESNALKVTDTQWIVSTTGTAQEVSAKLGIYDPAHPEVIIGQGIVFATSGYFGRAPANVWEWIKAKLETAKSA